MRFLNPVQLLFQYRKLEGSILNNVKLDSHVSTVNEKNAMRLTKLNIIK
jgi:hypothetical protein